MTNLEFLSQRFSASKLTTPGPNTAQLDAILAVGARAPDHGALQPWQFMVMTGQGLERLGEIFAQAATLNSHDMAKITKCRQMPLRAPMVITVIAKTVKHVKVPWLEQVQSAGCALFSMQQAALALGFSGIWRTGDLSQDKYVREQLGLNEQDEIVGFLYLGTDQNDKPVSKTVDLDKHVTLWQ